eukprot:TRINITY_DN3077_c0_g1_i1.p1 TRINITY_DN3077_c0_g1~~TRINITY_DN3077_c0_g1_i1.p1  ORF type:complete len:159 (-),score=6.87 TRINITY_DN3077_c0_g1_i1:310-786(-)
MLTRRNNHSRSQVVMIVKTQSPSLHFTPFSTNEFLIRRNSAGIQAKRESVRIQAQGKPGGNVLDRPATEIKPGKVIKKQKAPKYRVMLHNDPVNKREYVVKVLMKVVDGMSFDEALNVMYEAHNNGIGLVIICLIESAQQYCQGLRSGGLKSTIEPDV